MNCTWQEDQAYRFADGSLEPRQAEAYATHLTECAVCRERVAAATQLDGMLKSGIAPLVAPPTLAGRVAAAVAAEREARPRFAWPRLLGRRALATVLASLALAVGLFTVAAGPESVLAVVQKALFFIPGIGISAVDEGYLVNVKPVVVKQGDITFTVEALLSDGKTTTVKYVVVGLPGGKQGWDPGEAARAPGSGDQVVSSQKGTARPRPPVLRDEGGREYKVNGAVQSVGGSEQENQVTGTLYFPGLPSELRAVELVMPVAYAVPATVVPGADTQQWVAEIDLAHPAQNGLPQAVPQTATATANGVTLRVTAVEAGADRTVVLVESDVPGAASVMNLSANGADPYAAVTLRDSKGRTYKRLETPSEGKWGNQELRESLYFEPLAPDAGELTLTVAAVQVMDVGEANVSISLAGHQLGDTWSLDRTVTLGNYKFQMNSATLAEDHGVRWLYVDVDLGPAVDGRLLTTFSVDLTHGGAAMGSLNGREHAQYSRFGLALDAGQQEAQLKLTHPMVNVTGPWELKFAAK